MCEFYSNVALLPHMKFSIGPLASITGARVLQHQCDRINTSKGKSGPTAASHTPYSTFHVLLRFTTISRKPTASQTEKKDNGANLLLSGVLSASLKYYKFWVWWKIGVHVQKGFLDCVTGRDAKTLELLLQSCRMVWCNSLKVEGEKPTKFLMK